MEGKLWKELLYLWQWENEGGAHSVLTLGREREMKAAIGFFPLLSSFVYSRPCKEESPGLVLPTFRKGAFLPT